MGYTVCCGIYPSHDILRPNGLYPNAAIAEFEIANSSYMVCHGII